VGTHQLNVDFKSNRAVVSLIKQGTPPSMNDYMAANVQFAVADNDQQREGAAEEKLRARAKQILLEAANSL
jgi:hypothetical protein